MEYCANALNFNTTNTHSSHIRKYTDRIVHTACVLRLNFWIPWKSLFSMHCYFLAAIQSKWIEFLVETERKPHFSYIVCTFTVQLRLYWVCRGGDRWECGNSFDSLFYQLNAFKLNAILKYLFSIARWKASRFISRDARSTRSASNMIISSW